MTIEELSARLETVERQNRRMRAAGGAALLLAAAAAGIGQAAPAEKTVEATRFVLLDGEGRTVSVWGAGEKGGPEISFLDADGKPRATLGLDGPDAPALRIRVPGKLGEVSVGCGPFGAPAVTVVDGAGEQRAWLGAWVDGSAGLTLLTPGMKERIRLMTTPVKGAMVSLFDEEHVERIGASVLERGSAGLMFFSRSGEVRASTVVEVDDLPRITLFGAKEKVRAELEVRGDGGVGLGLRDPEGGIRAALGPTAAGHAGVHTVGGEGKPLITRASRASGDMNLAFSAGGERPLAEVGATLKGGPGGKAASFFALRGPDGGERMTAQAIEGKGMMIRLHDERGRPRSAYAVSATGEAGLGVTDEKGRPRLTLGWGGTEEGIRVVDEEGKVVGKFP